MEDHLLDVYSQLPFEPVSGDGVMLRTRDGRQILDMYGGHAVASVGYNHPVLTRALTEQVKTLLFQTNAVPLAARSHAAERLAGFAPDGLDKVFFVSSGAEANENALKLALKLSGRSRIVAIEHGFHGRTAAAGAVTWGARNSWYGFPQTPFDVSFVPRNDIAAVSEQIGTDTAAVIIEPVQGVAGAFDFDPAFIAAVRNTCDAQGAFLIMDEVQTGVGRLGESFGAAHFGVRPDFLTTAKALGGGVACAALLVGKEIAGEIKVGELGTTFGGGPLAAAAVTAVVDIIEREGLLANVRERSAQIRATCQTGPVTGISGLGFLLGLRTVIPAREVRDALLAQEILVGTSADPHVIRLLPPYILNQQHVARLAAALEEIPA
jgi:acetylornithine/succinyldiaminopimelate/putrescine aminotransferase